MHALRIMMCLFLSLLFGCVAHAHTLLVMLPPDTIGPPEPLIQQFAELMPRLTPSDRVEVYAAQGTRFIARIAVPDDPRATNPAWLKRQLGAQFAPVLRYLNERPPGPPPGTMAANLMIPDALDALGRNVIGTLPEKRADILLFGSWLYFDPRDARWNMTERYYPADGHLLRPASETPYGIADATNRLTGATVHFCWPGGESAFATPEHAEAVRRFWTLRVTGQTGRIGTFSHDLATCFRRAAAGEASGQPSYSPSRDPKVEMLRARAPSPAVLPASMEQPGEYFLRDDVPISRTPPATTSGVAWIGLKWSSPCDVDLYARPDASAQWLFFGNIRTAAGRFNKDFQSSTGEKQFEYVEFLDAIDLTKAEAAINLYAGELPAAPEGVVRVWFGGQVYEAPFKIAATRGNRGASPMTGANWVRIDLRKIVGLAP